jgi:DNA-dependent RNA polymerase auxiliary subunit epsilon
MNVLIVNPLNKRTSLYTQKQLAKDARRLVKGKGKLAHFHVEIVGGIVKLVASYYDERGWNTNVSEVI